ncbi:MAG: hypothetical protein ACR5K7_04745 [Symbiopectobacterium sp.]
MLSLYFSQFEADHIALRCNRNTTTAQ